MANASGPISPYSYGSEVGDFEEAIAIFAETLDGLKRKSIEESTRNRAVPSDEPYESSFKKRERFEATRAFGIQYLKLLALADYDGTDKHTLLFSGSADIIVEKLKEFAVPRKDAEDTDTIYNPLVAELVLEISRQRLTAAQQPGEVETALQDAVAALAWLGRSEQIEPMLAEHGRSLEELANSDSAADRAMVESALEAYDASDDVDQANRLAMIRFEKIPASDEDARFELLDAIEKRLLGADRKADVITLWSQMIERGVVPAPMVEGYRAYIGVLLIDIERFNEAEPVFRSLIDNYPDNPNGYYQLARIFKARGDLAGLKSVQEKFPHIRELAALRAEKLFESGAAGEVSDAISVYETAPSVVKSVYDEFFTFGGKADWLSLGAVIDRAQEGASNASDVENAIIRFSSAGVNEAVDLLRPIYLSQPEAKSGEEIDAVIAEWLEYGEQNRNRPGQTPRGFDGDTSNQIGELASISRDGLPPSIPMRVVYERLDNALARNARAPHPIYSRTISLGWIVAQVRREWTKALELERLAVDARPENPYAVKERVDFFERCPTTVASYRRFEPEGTLFADFAECDYTTYDAGLPAESMAFLALQHGASMDGILEALQQQENRRESEPLDVFVAWRAGEKTADPARQDFVFRELQEAMLGEAGNAVIRGAAARIAARIDPALVDAIDTFTALSEDHNRIGDPVPPPTDNSAEALERRRQENRAAREIRDNRKARIDQLESEIRSAFPRYFDFIKPRALSIEEARDKLSDDEAIVVIYPAQTEVHVLAISKTNSQWHAVPYATIELSRDVRRLLWDVGSPGNYSQEEKDRWAADAGPGWPFERSLAFKLYDRILKPVEGVFEGKTRLFVSASGWLGSMPLGMLVTEAPNGADNDPDTLRNTAWLAEEIAIINLPSIASLRLLDEEDADPSQSDFALAGFGDPLLIGEAVSRGVLNNSRSGAGVVRSAKVNDTNLPFVERLRNLSRLKGTERELNAIKEALGASEEDVKLQERATEPSVRDADLSDVSILVFATHGVMPREMAGLDEPGLVMTPPLTASEADDGFLSASEIAALKLDADWVLLSACNTAVGGSGATSNLTDAFFFAGARSVLATHWYVDDDAAEALTAATFRTQKDNPRLSRAEALQVAMRTVRDNTDLDDKADFGAASWAHPRFWASHSIYGDVD
uniref:CHAT domain-containing protein n=1 Tax=Parerythrobacter lutipelagi TaxID=1964208 RepID=UPI0010F94468|nr:CHAT domain-containing protein [Parerythrobacter lutipelagi]